MNFFVILQSNYDKMKVKDKISKEELIKIQTAQSFFLQPPNKCHRDRSKYSRKDKHKKNYK